MPNCSDYYGPYNSTNDWSNDPSDGETEDLSELLGYNEPTPLTPSLPADRPRWPNSVTIEQQGYGIANAKVIDSQTGETVHGVLEVEIRLSANRRYESVLRLIGTRVARPRTVAERTDLQVVEYPILGFYLGAGVSLSDGSPGSDPDPDDDRSPGAFPGQTEEEDELDELDRLNQPF